MARHLLGLSGKDSLTTAIILKIYHTDIWEKIELFTNDIKTELPEKEAWMIKCEEYLEKPIHRIEKDLLEVIQHHSRNYEGLFLPSFKVRYCTRDSKIKPMQEWLGEDEAIL
jgi:3'-phosphoadenosine 5'-phosphosulfate sulfotransferase (PAPS reductase)/FAD synthetase